MTASEHAMLPDVEKTTTETPPVAPAPPPKKRLSWLRRLLRLLLCFVLVSLLLLIGGLVWLLSTEEGLRFGLAKLPPLAGVNISSKTLQGSVWHGFKGDAWRIETESADIDISRFDFQWQPQALWQNKLHIQRLAAGDILIVSKPTPPKESQPSKLPESIRLPMAVQLDSLSVGKISIKDTDNVVLKGGELAYVYDHQNHLITLKHLQSPWSSNQGKLTLNTVSPFALTGQITGGGEVENIPVEGIIDLGGSLQQLTLNANLQGGKVNLMATTQLSPFENSLNKIIGNLHIKGKGINPVDFLPSAPQADLEFDAFIIPTDAQANLALEGAIDLANHAAAPADKKGIPVRSIVGDFTINQAGILQLAPTDVQLLKKGIISLQGDTDTANKNLNIDAQLKNITLDDLIQQSFADALNGSIQLRGNYTEPKALWTLNSQRVKSQGEVQLTTDTNKGQQTILLNKASFTPQNGGEMNLAGKLELFNKQQLQLNLTSKNFNPNKIYPDFPTGDVNGEIKLNGELTDLVLNGKMNFAPSTLSGVTLRGTADVQYQQQHLSRAISDIALGRNHLRTHGSFGKAGDKLNIDLNAPELDKVGFGLSGALTAQGYIAGEPQKIEANLTGNARNLKVQQAAQIQQLDFKIQGSPDLNRPLNLQLQGKQLIITGDSPTRIDHVNLGINGTGTRHSIQGNGSMALDGKPYKLNLAANGGLSPQNQWKGTINTLDINGAFNLKLQNSMNLEAGAERVSMSAARWAMMGGSLNLNSFIWDKAQGLTSKGSASNLHISQLHNFFTPPVEHNIVLNSDWDLAYSQNARGYLNVRRQSGDIILPTRKQALGLSNLELNTRFQNGRIDNTIKGTTRFGDLLGSLAISQQFGNDLTRAPINGNLRLNIPDLNSFRNLMPVGQTVKGSLTAQANIGGTVGTPLLNGTLNGDKLYYINRDIGLILDNGSLRSRLAGQKWHIDSLRFQRGGTIILNGDVSLDKGSPDVNVQVAFDKYEALDKPSRRLTLSGNTKLHYMDSAGVTLSGILKVDDGHFGFQKSSMPTLSDDVVIVGEAPKVKSPPTKINLDLTLDLNDRFRFSGEGLDVTLGGKLDLRAKPNQDVQGIGTVKVVKGKYKAYGQDLNISKGAISFVGPLDNPNLNIRAVRNLSPVGAGVEVLGNLNTPRITLVANETMSEKDKLSWLILNRASSGSDGDEAALSAAAGAFLAGKINDKIGLVDDFGMTSKRSRNAQTGELNPAEQVLTVGKQLSSELYLGYEYGINSADQSVKLIYQLTRHIQAIARVGSRSSGGEMKYVIRFD